MLTIHYSWHPWSGRTVQLVKAFERGRERRFRVDLIEETKTKRMDVPAWMFDRSICSILTTIPGEPYVPYGTLHSLRELIQSSSPDLSRNQVEQEHLPLTPKGNAHEKSSKVPSRTAKSVRRKAKSSKANRSSNTETGSSARTGRPDSY